jgi:hypothetical protein
MLVHMVHACELREWENPHRARFTDWHASCGASGTQTGWHSTGTAAGLSSLDFAVRKMLCRVCCAGMLT